MDFAEKFRRAKIHMILNSKLRIFGCILYKFDFKMSSEVKFPAAVTIIRNKPTIILNPEQLNNCSIKQLLFIILHEMLHVINNHLAYKVNPDNINFKIANLAQDHCINKMLIADANGELRESLAAISGELEPVLFHEISHENWHWEEVYSWLLTKYQDQIFNISFDPDTNKITINGTEYDMDILSSGENGDEEGNDPNISDTISQDLKSVIRSVIDNNIGNCRGNANSKIFEHLNEISQIKLPWANMLEKVICRHVIPSIENRSWKSYNKFLRNYAMLPSFDTEVVYNTMYVVIDVSGSVGSDDLMKFMGVIENSLDLFKQIRIIQHSTDITFNQLFPVEDILQNKEILLEVYGRGGTSHTDCFNFIEEHYEEDNVEFVIFLTDFESNIEHIWNKYEWVNEVPCKFVLNRDNEVPEHIDDSPILIDKYIQ